MQYIKKKDSVNFKNQVCTAYNTNGNWRELANTLGVKLSTAYYWIKNQSSIEGRRGGRRRTKITDEHRTFMELSVEKNPKMTLRDLQLKLICEFGIEVSTLISFGCVEY